jgi:hypothetical protein
MKKRYFILPFLFLVALLTFTLASCSSESFGDKWIKAANDLALGPDQDYFDEDYYKVISLDKAKKMIDEDETFLVLLGNRNNNDAIYNVILRIPYDAKNVGYEGKFYFIDTTSLLEDNKSSEITKKLGIKAAETDHTDGIVMVCYNDGKKNLDTSAYDPDKSGEEYNFLKGASGNKIDIHAVVTFAIEYYPLDVPAEK